MRRTMHSSTLAILMATAALASPGEAVEYVTREPQRTTRKDTDKRAAAEYGRAKQAVETRQSRRKAQREAKRNQP